MDAELVFKRDGLEVIARAKAAIVIDEEFRHDEQRDALRSLGRIGQAS